VGRIGFIGSLWGGCFECVTGLLVWSAWMEVADGLVLCVMMCRILEAVLGLEASIWNTVIFKMLSSTTSVAMEWDVGGGYRRVHLCIYVKQKEG
jgi:hypothetical protein